MRVGQRLFLAVVPAVLGVLTVAGLAYWGQYAHTAPEWLVGIAVVVSISSLVMAWTNTRYVARRVERLAGERGSASSDQSRGGVSVLRGAAASVTEAVTGRPYGSTDPDELDTIEEVVDRLSSAVTIAEATRDAQARSVEAQRREHAALVADTADAVSRQIDEILLPLHILLANHFGELNENQEEMIGAAGAAADKASAALGRLREIAQLDSGLVTLRRDSIRISDAIGSLLPSLTAEGRERDIRVSADIEPALPSIPGDRSRLHEAIGLALRDALQRTPDGGTMEITVTRHAAGVRLRCTHGPVAASGAELALATRIVAAHGGRLTDSGDAVELYLSRS